MAALAAAACWMMQVWLPPGWALAGALLLGTLFNGTSYWINSYWGGAVAAVGGCLILGAVGCLLDGEDSQTWLALIFAAGLIIVANTRPWEGAMTAAPLVAAFLYWVFRSKNRTFGWRVRRVLFPWLLVLATAAGAMSYYCWRVTGNMLQLPYLLNRNTYAIAPVFIWEKERPKPAYRHPVMERFYTEWETGYQESKQLISLSNYPRIMMRRALTYPDFHFPAICSLLLVIAVGGQKHRVLLLAMLITFLTGIGLQRYIATHYCAPMMGAVIMIPMIVLAEIAKPRPSGGPAGMLIANTVMALLFLLLAGRNLRGLDYPSLFAADRRSIESQLASSGDDHLVVVRYGPDHDVHKEWVYNGAEIDSAKVVWAREMDNAHNKQLFQYFHNRQVWLLEPDSFIPKLTRLR